MGGGPARGDATKILCSKINSIAFAFQQCQNGVKQHVFILITVRANNFLRSYNVLLRKSRARSQREMFGAVLHLSISGIGSIERIHTQSKSRCVL